MRPSRGRSHPLVVENRNLAAARASRLGRAWSFAMQGLPKNLPRNMRCGIPDRVDVKTGFSETQFVIDRQHASFSITRAARTGKSENGIVDFGVHARPLRRGPIGGSPNTASTFSVTSTKTPTPARILSLAAQRACARRDDRGKSQLVSPGPASSTGRGRTWPRPTPQPTTFLTLPIKVSMNWPQ